MKLFALLTIGLFLMACVQQNSSEISDIPKEPLQDEGDSTKGLHDCSMDSDCVPLPGCHPMECINKEFESNYKKPEMCTMMYSPEAAYNADDCACREDQCVNKNKH